MGEPLFWKSSNLEHHRQFSEQRGKDICKAVLNISTRINSIIWGGQTITFWERTFPLDQWDSKFLLIPEKIQEYFLSKTIEQGIVINRATLIWNWVYDCLRGKSQARAELAITLIESHHAILLSSHGSILDILNLSLNHQLHERLGAVFIKHHVLLRTILNDPQRVTILEWMLKHQDWVNPQITSNGIKLLSFFISKSDYSRLSKIPTFTANEDKKIAVLVTKYGENPPPSQSILKDLLGLWRDVWLLIRAKTQNLIKR